MEDYKHNAYMACMYYCSGKPYGVSTGICGSITMGYGELDENGYWEFPLPEDVINEILKEKGLK